MNISVKNEYLKIIDECVKATDSCEIKSEGLKVLSDSIEKQELLLPVIGAFSSGKSSLLNSFLNNKMDSRGGGATNWNSPRNFPCCRTQI